MLFFFKATYWIWRWLILWNTVFLYYLDIKPEYSVNLWLTHAKISFPNLVSLVRSCHYIFTVKLNVMVYSWIFSEFCASAFTRGQEWIPLHVSFRKMSHYLISISDQSWVNGFITYDMTMSCIGITHFCNNLAKNVSTYTKELISINHCFMCVIV